MASICLRSSRRIIDSANVFNVVTKVQLNYRAASNPNFLSYSCYSTLYNNKNSYKNKSINKNLLNPALVYNVRACSTNVKADEVVSNYIPSPPVVAEVIDDAPTNLEIASSLLEPSFASQGLGGYSPIGLIQNAFEFMHVTVGLPWWGTIVASTLIVRLCMFPIVIKSQQYSGKMHKNLPQMQVLQQNMMEARRSGDQMQSLRAANELAEFVKDKEINPFKQMLVPLCQAPVFISFFMALRRMANHPVESMTTGGLFWFTDLTIADPFYITPIITSATLLLTIEIGSEGIRADSMGMMKYFFRAMPIFILPFSINFPAAILCYWMTSNAISLVQVSILRIPTVRKSLNIPAIVKHNPASLPISNKGFFKSIKENFKNQRLINEVEERHKIDQVKFRKAGIGPIEKTYPYNPKTQKSSHKS